MVKQFNWLNQPPDAMSGGFNSKLSPPNTTNMGQRIERDLPCKLTEEELAETAHALALNVAEYNALEDEKKEVMQQYNERLKLLDTLQRRMAKIVEEGKEDRPVMCQVDYHAPESGYKQIIRQDTFEVVETLPMNKYDDEAYYAEMQPEIPFQ